MGHHFLIGLHFEYSMERSNIFVSRPIAEYNEGVSMSGTKRQTGKG